MINFYVHGQTLTVKTPPVVADSVNYLEARAMFSTSDWDGLTVKAVFTLGDTVYAIPLTDGMIRREDHLNLSAGEWRVHLVGYVMDGEELVMRITTFQDRLPVKPSGAVDGSPLPQIPASDTERLEGRMDALDKELDEIKESGVGGGVELEDDGEGNLAIKTTAGNTNELEEKIAELSKEISDKLDKKGDTLGGKIVLPTGAADVGFTNSEDVKIFGYGAGKFRIGDAGCPVELRGSSERPKYNDIEMVLKTEFDNALGSYIVDIDSLVGGE